MNKLSFAISARQNASQPSVACLHLELNRLKYYDKVLFERKPFIKKERRRYFMGHKKNMTKSIEVAPISQKARLSVDYSEENSFEAINILRDAGFRVTATQVSGLSEPELTLGSTSYRGIAEIRQLVEDIKVHSK